MRYAAAFLLAMFFATPAVAQDAMNRYPGYHQGWIPHAPQSHRAARTARIHRTATYRAKHKTRHRRAPARDYTGRIASAPPASIFEAAGSAIAEPVRQIAAVIGGRPQGCPARFCGCGASLHLFGRIIPSLNLAANWLRFPRTAPAPNMVAARRGHVFVLKQHIAGATWLVFDANSGGRKTRIHPRSIAGYAIVNPRSG